MYSNRGVKQSRYIQFVEDARARLEKLVTRIPASQKTPELQEIVEEHLIALEELATADEELHSQYKSL